ncbi:M protein, serotype 5-like [Macrobrachium nipponense]|uniref:M protein, serotype 5-like n=1 Tax=Macrobrachium nipponense TaxID=159736 RepID=UPI0030C86060
MIAALQDTIQCQREQRVNLGRIILQLQQRLDYYEEIQKAGGREERTRVIQSTQEVLQDRAHSLEAETLFLKRENDHEKREKRQVEDKILKITEENQQLKDNAKEIGQRNDALSGIRQERPQAEVQRLQKEVEDFTKEKCGLQCKVEAAKLKRNELTCLIEERNSRLESLERKTNVQGERNDQLEDEVRQLRGAKEKLVCDLKNLDEK